MSWSSRDLAPKALAVALVAIAHPVAAAVTPGIAVEGRVTAADNPFLLRGGESALLVEGSLLPSLSYEDADGSSLALDGVLTGRQYSRRYGSYILGAATAAGELRDSERLSVTGLASYTRDIAADVLTEDVGGSTDTGSVRNAWRGRAGLTWRPSARDSYAPSLDYERVDYEGDPSLRATTALTGDFAWSRRLTERTTLGARALARRSRTEGEGRVTTVAAFATLDQRLNPTWRLSGDAGAERVRQGGPLLPGLRRTRTSFTGRARLCNDGERVTGCLDLSLASEVSPLGGVQRRYTIGVDATWRLAERWALQGNAEYSKAERSRQSAAPALGGALARLALAWDANRRTTISGDLEYRRREFGFGRSANGVFAGVGVRWGTR